MNQASYNWSYTMPADLVPGQYTSRCGRPTSRT